MSLDELLPAAEPFDPTRLPAKFTYIGAAGFEDRAFAYPEAFLRYRFRPSDIICIEYRPFDEKNRVKDFRKKMADLGFPDTEQPWIIYDRMAPESFSVELSRYRDRLRGAHVVVDISAMSKFLILVILDELRDCGATVTIVYSEAEVYHPTREAFERERAKLPTATSDFLTSEVKRIVTTSGLSSVAMQGYPIVAIAFPTFNHRELSALVSDILPRTLIQIEGKPRQDHNAWRKGAIAWVNQGLREYMKKTVESSTFDYRETVNALSKLYDEYSVSNRILIAPTGSKMQAVAVFVMKQLRPDVQVVYPVARQFVNEYSVGIGPMWVLQLGDYDNFLRKLDSERNLRVRALLSEIAARAASS
jgi:hypothetical protein